VTIVALGLLALARPSVFTSPLVIAGLGHRFAEPRPDSFYAVRVAPILEEQCAGCHGPRLQRARLRVDSLGDVILGGKSGRVVVAGNPAESELYRRLLLPASDPRAMPAGNKPPLSAPEKRVIELWIASGASGHTRVAEIADAPPPPSPPVKIETLDAEAVAAARASLEVRVRELGERYPGSISYLSRSSADLGVDVQRLGPSFGDEDLARLTPLAAAITRLDVSRTAVTDAAPFAAFDRLEHLRVDDTAVGDGVVDAASQLRALKSLALVGTRASAARIAGLRATGVRVYDGSE
jgi:hypothetical protein